MKTLFLCLALLAYSAKAQPLRQQLVIPPATIQGLQHSQETKFEPVAYYKPWPFMKVSASLGINTMMWDRLYKIPAYLGYDLRVKFYLKEDWKLLLRYQTMYVDADLSFLVGASYTIPLHLPKRKKPKL